VNAQLPQEGNVKSLVREMGSNRGLLYRWCRGPGSIGLRLRVFTANCCVGVPWHRFAWRASVQRLDTAASRLETRYAKLYAAVLGLIIGKTADPNTVASSLHNLLIGPPGDCKSSPTQK